MIIDIHLPKDGEILIHSGQKVDFDTPILKRQTKTDITVPLASHLKIPAKKIFNSLKKFVGEQINKGDLLAESKGMMGSKKYYSQTDGVLKEVNHNEGYIVIEADSGEEDTTLAFFKGEVSDVDDRVVKLKVENSKKFPLEEASEQFGGKVFYFKNVSEPVTSDHVENKVVLVKEIPGYDLIKMETLGATGFIHATPLSETTSNPKAQIDKSVEWEDIIKLQYPYCIIDKNNTTMYLYE